MLGLALPQLLAANQGKGQRTDKSVILFFLQGGQSQIDLYDMKPDAPEQIRGEFKPISSTVPGLQICEHLPRLAKQTKKLAIIRSMQHDVRNHNPAGYIALTGWTPSRDVVAFPATSDDYPNPGCVVSLLKPARKPIPPFVQLSAGLIGDATTQVPGQNSGFLGARFDPLKVTADPSATSFSVEELSLPLGVDAQRMATRRTLLAKIDAGWSLIKDSDEIAKLDTFYQRAFTLLTSDESRQAFNIAAEPASVRDRYGRFVNGQRLLLARRLIEAGVRLVNVYWGGAINDPDDYWDTHKGNFTKQKAYLLPQFDQCFSALLEDLDQRGLLDTTLVIAMGEFGRTPKIGQITSNGGTDLTGRDHWPHCYSILLAGCGIRGGQTIGRSDETTSSVVERPVHPQDIIATIYHALGLDYEVEIKTRENRPTRATRGEPVRELWAG